MSGNKKLCKPSNKHKESKRIVPGADTVIVFIHGILGTPDHFTELTESVPAGYSYVNILLPGHGASVDDFIKSTMKQWKSYVSEVIDEMSFTHENIYIVAHSMGTLFALLEAARTPKVKGLFLLNVPLRPYLHPRLMLPLLLVAMGVKTPGNDYVNGIRAEYSLAPDRNILKYLFWIPNYIALFNEIVRIRPLIRTITIPVYVLQSRKDELVLRSAYSDLNAPKMKKGWLKYSGHFFYDRRDQNKVKHYFTEWMNEKE